MIFTIDHTDHPNHDFLLSFSATDPQRETILVTAAVFLKDADELAVLARHLGGGTPIPTEIARRTGLQIATPGNAWDGGLRLTMYGSAGMTTLIIPKAETARLTRALLEKARATTTPTK